MASYAVFLLAAGKSSRFKGKEKKTFADLNGRAVWLHSLERFSIREEFAQILIAISPDDREVFDRRYRANVAFLPNAKVIEGGEERYDTVEKCLLACKPDVDYILIHDAARPCLEDEMVERLMEAVEETGAASLGVPLADTLKRVDNDRVVTETLPREGLWLTQTPQAFKRQTLLDAYAHRDKVTVPVTDDAMLVEALGTPVTMVEGGATNIKITTGRDLGLATSIIKSRPKPKDKGGFHPFADEGMWK
ncbi:2-C-methyl-D-erythritol 4-phosphate cytidylyltransferase [Planctomycetes bacterium Pan216]|uniref:2-C-methyl-D-erythritol 4-phosphate cytidylyltransferase n=1 Tax=Kolteria novifilia TaxID=2527975 RepID=A0A518B837_9BACT|nr:2-C-methyl-D-erythritol 4-phosphate cytidylyltransferase [Planctomycetes bacterium Pan216]